RLGFEHLRLFGERIDSHAGCDRRLLNPLELEQARDRDDARPLLAQFLLDEVAERVEQRRHLLAAEFRRVSELLAGLRLRRWLVRGHLVSPNGVLRKREYTTSAKSRNRGGDCQPLISQKIGVFRHVWRDSNQASAAGDDAIQIAWQPRRAVARKTTRF